MTVISQEADLRANVTVSSGIINPCKVLQVVRRGGADPSASLAIYRQNHLNLYVRKLREPIKVSSSGGFELGAHFLSGSLNSLIFRRDEDDDQAFSWRCLLD